MIIRKGISYILIATLAFAIMNVMAKNLSNMHPMQVVFFRSIGTFIFILPWMIYKKVSFSGTHVKFLFLRGLVGFISLSCFFIVVQRIPLGSAISLRYLAPIFGAIMAVYFLKEKVNKFQWLSFFIAFVGVFLLKGFDLRIDTMSFVLILISAVMVGMVFVLIRYLSSKEHYLTIISYFMITSIIGSLFWVSNYRMPVSDEWLSVAGIGVFGLIGQIYMTKGFELEEASVLAPFKYMELVYAMILGFFFFNESYSLIPMLGIVLIMLGMLMNVKAKTKRQG